MGFTFSLYKIFPPHPAKGKSLLFLSSFVILYLLLIHFSLVSLIAIYLRTPNNHNILMNDSTPNLKSIDASFWRSVVVFDTCSCSTCVRHVFVSDTILTCARYKWHADVLVYRCCIPCQYLWFIAPIVFTRVVFSDCKIFLNSHWFVYYAIAITFEASNKSNFWNNGKWDGKNN